MAKQLSNPCPGSERTALAQRAAPEHLDEGGNFNPETAEFVGDCPLCKAVGLPMPGGHASGRVAPHNVTWDA